MGTRADFYIGRGEQAEWLGSIAWDGHPQRLPKSVKQATTPEEFKAALTDFFEGRDDVTTPDMGWPWPWDNSLTTDYSYALDDGKVWGTCFGWAWFEAAKGEPDDALTTEVAVFPNMKGQRKMAEPGTQRSGVLVVRIGPRTS